MRIRSLWVMVVGLVVVAYAGSAAAQPGTAFIQARGGTMIPIGSFHEEQNPGGAYTIAAGYEFTDFLDWSIEFTHSFNDNDNFTFNSSSFRDDPGDRFPDGVLIESDQLHQTFVVSTGPRINFMPSGTMLRPFMHIQAGWYHFADFNEITFDGVTILDDADRDAFGFQAGLGVDGTIFQVFERRGDAIPLYEVTLGIHGAYHHAVLTNRLDRQFVTAMGTLGFRF